MKNTLIGILNDPAFSEGEAWHRRLFAENEIILREGDEDRKMYLIESGVLRVSGRVELDSERHIQPGLCDLSAGDIFGELTLFDAHPRTASVIAVSAGELREIDCRCLSDYLERRPELGYKLLKAMFNVLTDRLSRANERVENLFAWGLKAHGIDKHL